MARSLDSFDTGACGPDLFGALQDPSDSALVYVYHQYLNKSTINDWAACQWNTSFVNKGLKFLQNPPLRHSKESHTNWPPPK